jgi:hypothetical protein
VKRNIEALIIVISMQVGRKVNVESTWSYLVDRRQDKIIPQTQLTTPLKMWKISNI